MARAQFVYKPRNSLKRSLFGVLKSKKGLFFQLNPNIVAVVVSTRRGELFWCLKKMTIGKIGMKRMKTKKRISRSLESK